MALKQAYFNKVRSGLQHAAATGKFVPGQWIAGHGSSGDDCPKGCGQGLIGWFVAVAFGGLGWARRRMFVGCTQVQVNEVLIRAGLTEDDIRRLAPEATWKHFDSELCPYYERRLISVKDWDRYIAKSMELADYFVRVLERVPLETAAVSKLPMKEVPSRHDIPIQADVVQTKSVPQPEPVALAA